MAQNGAVPELPDGATKPPEGIVLPPRDIRAIIEKTAGYVARNGPVFEDRIRDKEQGNPKFSFLAPGDAYAGFYQWRLSEVRSGRGTAVSAGRTGESTARPEKAKGPERPPDFVFSARMPNISAQDLEVIKLTALHVARKGKSWMTALSQRESRNYQFDFLRSAHSLHPFFQRLVDQYMLLLQTGPEAQKAEQARIQALQANLQDRFRALTLAKKRAEYVKFEQSQKQKKEEAEEAERIAYAQIDWHDFVVVETVLFTDADDQAELPPPTTLGDLQSASLEQKAMMSLAGPDMRIEEAMPTDDMAGYAYTDPYQTFQTSTFTGELPAAPGRPAYMASQPEPVGAAPPPPYSSASAASSTAPATSTPSAPQAVPGKPTMRIRQDYVPRAQQRAQRAQTALCPNCGQQIPLAELDNHLRIELLDPEWKKQQAKATARSATTNLGGTDVAANLKRLRARTDASSLSLSLLPPTMLRPATPLTLALLVSFVFLLLSTISTPVVKSIPLATFEGVNFGVFGFCSGDRCTPARVGYTTDGAFSSDDGDFQLPANTRHSLSSLLIVHPWGSWIVLASVICIAVSGVFTCAMRRTLVSRKARKKRIAENAEMSGENFYARQAAQDKITPTALSVANSDTHTAMGNGASGSNPVPSFATYDAGRRIDDDRQPLNPAHGANFTPVTSRGDGSDPYYNEPSSGPITQPFQGSRLPPSQYTNPLPVQPVSDRVPPLPIAPAVRARDPSPFQEPDVAGAMAPPRQAYPPAIRARGGYPPTRDYPPRRPYGPSSLPQSQGYGRGGYAGPSRPGRGGFIAPGVVAGVAAGMRREQHPPPPGYGPRQGQSLLDEREGQRPGFQYPPQEGYHVYGQRVQSPARSQGSRGPSPAGGARAESPRPPMPNLPRQPSAASAEEARAESPPPLISNMPRQPSNSRGPPAEYVPARSGWNQAVPQSAPPPLADPVGATYAQRPGRPRVNSGGSDVYYEDVDPRFAPSGPMPAELAASSGSVAHIPPPSGRNEEASNIPIPQQLNPPIKSFSSYEDLPGARSPAESEASNFTSVSQRGVNPNWRPGYGPDNFNSFGPAARPGPAPAQQRRDVLLAGNPDFELPTISRPSARGGIRGGLRGGLVPRRPVPSALPPSAIGAADGPYPTAAPALGSSDVREV
ncbi:hypothetical protein DV735_g363, partial [Chaetothyriales sp. CBS 134920]